MDIRQTMTIQRIRSAHRIDQIFGKWHLLRSDNVHYLLQQRFIQTFPISTKFG